jgi:hypothetical protein
MQMRKFRLQSSRRVETSALRVCARGKHRLAATFIVTVLMMSGGPVQYEDLQFLSAASAAPTGSPICNKSYQAWTQLRDTRLRRVAQSASRAQTAWCTPSKSDIVHLKTRLFALDRVCGSLPSTEKKRLVAIMMTNLKMLKRVPVCKSPGVVAEPRKTQVAEPRKTQVAEPRKTQAAEPRNTQAAEPRKTQAAQQKKQAATASHQTETAPTHAKAVVRTRVDPESAQKTRPAAPPVNVKPHTQKKKLSNIKPGPAKTGVPKRKTASKKTEQRVPRRVKTQITGRAPPEASARVDKKKRKSRSKANAAKGRKLDGRLKSAAVSGHAQTSLSDGGVTLARSRQSDGECLAVRRTSSVTYMIDNSGCEKRRVLAAIELRAPGRPIRCFTKAITDRLAIAYSGKVPPQVNFECVSGRAGCNAETIRDIFPECAVD